MGVIPHNRAPVILPNRPFVNMAARYRLKGIYDLFNIPLKNVLIVILYFHLSSRYLIKQWLYYGIKASQIIKINIAYF